MVAARTHSQRLVVLGDFLHVRLARTASVIDALHAWRLTWPSLTCVLVRGNHDDRAGDSPERLGFDIHDEPWLLDGVACMHVTVSDRAGRGALRPGRPYLHPVSVIQGRGRDQLRLPCFDMGPRVGVLPAFGAFTGGWEVAARAGHI